MSTIGTKVKGKLKKAEGRLTGDRVREAQGAVEDAAGTVGGKIESGIRRAKTAVARKAVTTKAGRKAIAAKVMP
jgi:uncharacterized protein YjbJ (UPF0337 family)